VVFQQSLRNSKTATTEKRNSGGSEKNDAAQAARHIRGIAAPKSMQALWEAG